VFGFSDVATAAYCPRKLYYRQRREAYEIPESVERRRELAFRYERLLADEAALGAAPIDVTPTQYRSRLGAAKARLDHWEGLVDPAQREVFLTGKDCRGVAHKLLDGEPTLSLVFTGAPPERGVWHPQSVRLVAAAKALSWERETAVERALAEYPTHGVIREIDIGPRRSAQYRAALQTAKAIDGPPARTDNDAKCDACEFSGQCGVRSRSLRSVLGL
jgi:CRISPR-associated exonuclease Cas4